MYSDNRQNPVKSRNLADKHLKNNKKICPKFDKLIKREYNKGYVMKKRGDL